MLRNLFAGLLGGSVILSTLGLAKAQDTERPIDYLGNSVSLHAGTDLAATFNVGSLGWTGGLEQKHSDVAGLVNLGVGGRIGIKRFMLGAQFHVGYDKRAQPDTLLAPGVSFGYLVPVTDGFGVLPQVRNVLRIPTANTSTTMQLTAEVGLPYAPGRHGFIEPFVAVGVYHSTANGQGILLFGGGYRIGVVF